MPRIRDDKSSVEQSKWLKSYEFHGLDFRKTEGEHSLADCPFCGGSKFSLSNESGQWRCFNCAEGTKKGGGNLYTFIRKLWEHGTLVSQCKNGDFLRNHRKLLSVRTLDTWGVRVNPITDEWVVPEWNQDSKLINLSKYVEVKKKWVLLATPGLEHGLYCPDGVVAVRKPKVFCCEGPWDAMALWEMLGGVKLKDGSAYQLQPTSNAEMSLLSNTHVIASPGCMLFKDSWVSTCSEKVVYLLFDSDHPKTNETSGADVGLQGYKGMKRTAEMLSRAGGAAGLHYLEWGAEGYDPAKPSGFDVRDLLTETNGVDIRGRSEQLTELLGKLKPIPDGWVAGRTAEARASGATDIECLPCDSWRELKSAWVSALRWNDGLDAALAVQLAASTSTMSVGSQLWVVICSPPSTGKTTIAEALSTNKKYVYAKDMFKGLHSAYNDGTDKDHSPIQRMIGKFVIIKDGDTLLASENRAKLLSELRAAWDRVLRSSSKIESKSFDSTGAMTFSINGTSRMYELDSSESGARFLFCKIMDGIDEQMEVEILERAVNQAFNDVKIESNCKLESQYDPDLLNAMRLTGGYLGYLRENANELLGQVDMSPLMRRKCIDYARFIAFLRARPPKFQDEVFERELAVRLVHQLTRLAVCLAVVFNKTEVDKPVMRVVRKVTIDTAKGKTLDLANKLYKAGDKGMEPRALSLHMAMSEKTMEPLRNFLVRIGVLEIKEVKEEYFSAEIHYRLTPGVRTLYQSTVLDDKFTEN